VPGKVQLAPSTRELVADAFPLTMRTVDVKGKGLMATYLVDPAEAPKYYHRPAGAAPHAQAAAEGATGRLSVPPAGPMPERGQELPSPSGAASPA
jgi:hypothetical protein